MHFLKTQSILFFSPYLLCVKNNILNTEFSVLFLSLREAPKGASLSLRRGRVASVQRL